MISKGMLNIRGKGPEGIIKIFILYNPQPSGAMKTAHGIWEINIFNG